MRGRKQYCDWMSNYKPNSVSNYNKLIEIFQDFYLLNSYMPNFELILPSLTVPIN